MKAGNADCNNYNKGRTIATIPFERHCKAQANSKEQVIVNGTQLEVVIKRWIDMRGQIRSAILWEQPDPDHSSQ